MVIAAVWLFRNSSGSFACGYIKCSRIRIIMSCPSDSAKTYPARSCTHENITADRVESDLRGHRYIQFLKTHINELWALNNHYYEFIEQFAEIARRFEAPADTIEQYGKFIEEYNLFVQNFRDAVNELKAVARTQLEAPSIKLAPEVNASTAVRPRCGRASPRTPRAAAPSASGA